MLVLLSEGVRMDQQASMSRRCPDAGMSHEVASRYP